MKELHAKIGQLAMENDFLAVALGIEGFERKEMIDRAHDLPISKQAKALNISRGSVYYLPRPVSAADLALMWRIDELHLEFPFAGARMLRGLLAAEGSKVGRRHVKTLMQRMGIEALYRRPRTSKPGPGHTIYPYLLGEEGGGWEGGGGGVAVKVNSSRRPVWCFGPVICWCGSEPSSSTRSAVTSPNMVGSHPRGGRTWRCLPTCSRKKGWPARFPKRPAPCSDSMLDLLASLNGKIADLDKEIARRAREDEVSRRLMTVPGIGPISATAIAALAPPAETFAKGRDFAAWLGLTPLQRSTGGKRKLGATSKMGERTLRRLLIIGSSTVVLQASKRGAPKGSWLEQMLARKPRMLVTVALANKMARIIWALLVKQENYRAPVAAKA